MTGRVDRYGDREDDDLEQPWHDPNCSGFRGSEDKPAACPVCKAATHERIRRQRLQDWMNR